MHHTTSRPSRRTARINRGSRASTLSAPMRVISVSRPGLVLRVEPVDEPQQIVGLEGRAAFHADRVFDAAHELGMRAVDLPRPIAEPHQMRRAVVPVAGGRIDPGQRLLV